MKVVWRICYDRCTTRVSGALAGREDTLRLATLPNRYLCDLFLLEIFFNRTDIHGLTLDSGAGGDVYLNGRGLKPVSGHRDTGAVNRAQNCQRSHA